MRIFNSCVVYQPPSQPHTFSARLLFDETFAQPVFAVVHCPFVALSVFYSTVFMRNLNIFAFVNCTDVALSVFSGYSPLF